MLAVQMIVFNGRSVETIGVVVGRTKMGYIVDFEHDGVEFRGIWSGCTIIS